MSKKYTVVFQKDTTLFDKDGKGFLYKQGEGFKDAYLLDTVNKQGHDYYILEVPIYGTRAQVQIPTDEVTLK